MGRLNKKTKGKKSNVSVAGVVKSFTDEGINIYRHKNIKGIIINQNPGEDFVIGFIDDKIKQDEIEEDVVIPHPDEDIPLYYHIEEKAEYSMKGKRLIDLCEELVCIDQYGYLERLQYLADQKIVNVPDDLIYILFVGVYNEEEISELYEDGEKDEQKGN